MLSLTPCRRFSSRTYDKVTEYFPETKIVVADAAYKTPHICKKVFEDGRVLSTAYKRLQTMKGGQECWKYVYDEFYDCVICPEYQPLKYRFSVLNTKETRLPLNA